MIIGALDVATQTGWAFYDLDRPPSAIVCGSFKCTGDGAFEKVSTMRQKLPLILRKYRPDFVAIEAPLDNIKPFKKTKQTLFGVEETGLTMNPKTITQLNRLAGAAQTVVEGFNIQCIEVRPQTWQTILPKSPGSTKDRAKAFCETVGIEGGNMDSRDAAAIAIWAAGRCQELKLMARAS